MLAVLWPANGKEQVMDNFFLDFMEYVILWPIVICAACLGIARLVNPPKQRKR